jgi:hypothetical protein
MGGSAPNLMLELIEPDGSGGWEVRATTTNNSVDTSSWADYSYEISDVSGISDWTDLYMRITMVNNMSSEDLMKVTQAYLQTQSAASSSAKIPVTLFINGMST